MRIPLRGVRIVVLGSLAMLLAVTAWAIENPVDKTGFHPTSIYENFGNESIDLLNGNLSLVFPFVPSLPVPGGKLELGTQAVYNSRAWKVITGITWMYGTPDPNETREMVQYYTHDAGGELGLGWTMNLGYMRDSEGGGKYLGVTYSGSDGGKHTLYGRLTFNTVFPFDLWNDTVFAMDGTYIRAVADFEPGTIPGQLRILSWTVHFPNGIKHELGHHVHLGAPYRSYNLNGWYPTRMTDPYGNEVRITYDPSYPRLIQKLETTLTDGTTRKIEFTATTQADNDFTPQGETPIFFEDFETTDNEVEYHRVFQAYPPDPNDLLNDLNKWSRMNTSKGSFQDSTSFRESVHVHHLGEPDYRDLEAGVQISGLYEFQDCLQDGGTTRSLYFGRDTDPFYTGSTDWDNPLTCTYDNHYGPGTVSFKVVVA